MDVYSLVLSYERPASRYGQNEGLSHKRPIFQELFYRLHIFQLLCISSQAFFRKWWLPSWPQYRPEQYKTVVGGHGITTLPRRLRAAWEEKRNWLLLRQQLPSIRHEKTRSCRIGGRERWPLFAWHSFCCYLQAEVIWGKICWPGFVSLCRRVIIESSHNCNTTKSAE